jgi:magnesium chelatase subunit D
VGTRRGTPRGGARLDLLETLRAAAPWQRLRGARRGASGGVRVQVRRDDFRIRRLVERTATTTIFAVDASGSAALQRLAETKGAVELMLADSYARRDRVGVIVFRGTRAELVLPPTRAVARAKRALAALAAGGGTPLAAALDLVRLAVLAAARDGSRAAVVLLSDARANVARSGVGGRAVAEADALDARRLAEEMGARYEPLPHPASQRVSEIARALSAPGAGSRDG